MATKPTFSKLKLQLNKETTPVQIGEQTIAVKQYLPIEEKLELITKVLLQAHEPESNYNNPVKTDAVMALEIIFAYTDLVFTEKQKEDLPKLYDLLKSNGIIDVIFNAIPELERFDVERGVYRTIDSVYAYQNSVLGILDNVKQSQVDTEGSLKDIQEFLQSDEIKPLKEIVSKLG